jgi:CubicO group peptidase (beta-lactamase class C family)
VLSTSNAILFKYSTNQSPFAWTIVPVKMYLTRYTLPLLVLFDTPVLADLLGPTYPAPIDLSSNDSRITASWKNLTSVFDAYLKDNQVSASSKWLSDVENVTFSVGLFSMHDPVAAQLQYHYTSPEIANARQGTKRVDGDSIYRIASVSKLFTVFAGMLKLSNSDWNRSLTDIILRLATFAQSPAGYGDSVDVTQWEEITPLTLAAQLSGIARDGIPATDLLYSFEARAALNSPNAITPLMYGFPPLNLSELGPPACRNLSDPFSGCSAEDDISSVRSLPPNLQSWTTPAYSNNGYMLLGIAISNITGKSMETIYRESIFEPLGMTSSNSSHPTGKAELARSVIAGEPAAGFALEGRVTIPSGGLLSTINDLAKFGINILNSTLLPLETTRKWMKPITHTASLSHSVGAPWEIHRYIHPSTGKVTDLYTKLGDSGYYGGNLVLIPDYGAGISILDASTQAVRGNVTNIVLDYVINSIIPALEAQAKAEATRNFVGTYASTDSNLNSSVTVAMNGSTTDDAFTGLSITRWISNGTDVLDSGFAGAKPKLLPSIPKQSDGPGKVGFQALVQPQTTSYTEAVDLGLATGPFTAQYATNFDWLTVGAGQYGGRGYYSFIFNIDTEGKATHVTPAAMRAKLQRE